MMRNYKFFLTRVMEQGTFLSPGNNQKWIYGFLYSDWLTQNQNIAQTAKRLRPRGMASETKVGGDVAYKQTTLYNNNTVGSPPHLIIPRSLEPANSSNQKLITQKRLTSLYMLGTMLGFFSRPIRTTEYFFAQIWNQRIKVSWFKKWRPLQRACLQDCTRTTIRAISLLGKALQEAGTVNRVCRKDHEAFSDYFQSSVADEDA